MPDELRRIVRRIQPAGPRSFDEHTWPIYVAVAVLCGYLCGVVISLLHFDDPRVRSNALTWLVAIVIAGAIAFWAVSFLQRSMLRRTLVFSILLSLIVNLSLFVIMAWTTIFHPHWNETEPKAAAQRKRQDVIIPDYPLFNDQQQQRVPQEFERPVETGEPEAERSMELTRQATQPPLQSADRPSAPSPSEAEPRAVSKPKRVEAPSAPRQSDTLAKLSRQPLRADLHISRQPNMPAQASSRASAPKAVVASQASALPQRQTRLAAPTVQDRSSREAPQVEIAKMARPPMDDAEHKVASLPTLKRSLRRPKQLPQTETPIEFNVSRAQRSESSLEANSTLMTKRTTSAPEQTAHVDLQPKVATTLDRRSQREQPETEALSASLSRANLANPSVSRTDVPSLSEVASGTELNASQPSASLAEAVRQPVASSNQVTTTPSASQPSPTLPPSSQTITRSAAVGEPSIAKMIADSRSTTRAAQMAQRAVSTSTDTASVAASFDAPNPASASEPSRMALSRSSVGVAGVGDASNLERGMAAPDSPITIASASANRARATQDLEQGPALSPSAPSLTRRLRANRRSPHTSMQAQEIDRAMVAGSKAPAAEAASSSASLERVASNVPSAPTTAAKGSAEIDLGPTRIAADTSSGRAEGGGQPELASGELPRALPREDSIAGNAGIRTDSEAALAAAPAAQDTSALQGETAAASGARIAKSSQASASADDGPAAAKSTGPREGVIRVARASGGRAGKASEMRPSLAAGGTSSPGRTGRSLQIKTSTHSQVPQLAGSEASAGSRRGDPLDAQATQTERASAGVLADHRGDYGAAEGDEAVDGSPGHVPALSFSRTDDPSAASGEALAVSRQDRGAPRTDRQTRVSGSSTNVELDPEEFAVNSSSSNPLDSFDGLGEGALIASSLSREPGGSLPVDVATEIEAGGLGDAPAIDSGILSRTASEESERVSLQPARFLRRTQPRASLAARTTVVTATKAYRHRVIRKGEAPAGERGLPSPKTEASIERGLVFLARFQSADGSWSFNNFADGKAELPEGEEAVVVSDTAATGLSLLSFLGAGYHHRADKYQTHVKNGLDFLVQHQREDGDLYIDQDANSSRSAWMYSHAIATIALCEALGMTQDAELRATAQKAVNFIVESQHPSRGGWRYSPAYGTDTSVSGWMTMALKSAELAELNVPKSAYVKIEHWLDLAQASDAQPYLYRYNPYAPETEEQRHGRRPTRAITAVGLLMRMYTGWRRDDPSMILGARTLAQNTPQLGTSSQPRRDTYYWYYATQVMYHMGGDDWERWNQALHPMLTRSQVKQGALSGSWNPLTPVPDRWGAYGGRLYVTTMNLLSLEVFYRHLPIYEDTSK